ncbi:MAG: hypothetical protein KAJ51_14665, partial [Thermoplasmata archaeon]|nr:hypothetical protein [Thermoplasmata archaeon]
TDKVVLYGGGYNDGFPSYNWYFYDDTWIYDLSDNNWTRKSTNINPGWRAAHSMAAIQGTDKVVLFGGHNWNWTYFKNETWVYDLSDNQWTLLSPENFPSKRHFFAMTSVYGTNKIILFGGYFPDFLNDTWVFNPSRYELQGTYITSPSNVRTNSTFKIIAWNASTSINSTIEFQFKTAMSESELNLIQFVGPDGTTNTFYSTLSSNIWSGHSGDHWIQYKVFFLTTNKNETPRLNDITIIYNCWPETFLISPEDGCVINNDTPTFMWNFSDLDSDSQMAFQVQLDNDIDFRSVEYDSGEVTSSSSLYTPLLPIKSGVWYWKARTKDNDGDWSFYSQPRQITIDSKAPSSTINWPQENGYYSTVDFISGMATRPKFGMGLNKV